MATSTPLEEPAALAKRIEDFVSAIERPMIAVPAARLAGYQGRYVVGNAPVTVAIADAWCSSSTATQTCHYSLQRHRTSSCARLAPDVRFEQDAAGHTVAMIITNAGGTPVRCPRI